MWTPEVNNALNDSINNPQSSSAKAAKDVSWANNWFVSWLKNLVLWKNNPNVAAMKENVTTRNNILDQMGK